MVGLGKDLHANAFVQERSDEEMVAFLHVGRPADDPLNTTGVAMPARGGNPAFTDEDLLDIVAYLRTLE
jgi:disulfide bond formation protein DsbB